MAQFSLLPPQILDGDHESISSNFTFFTSHYTSSIDFIHLLIRESLNGRPKIRIWTDHPHREELAHHLRSKNISFLSNFSKSFQAIVSDDYGSPRDPEQMARRTKIELEELAYQLNIFYTAEEDLPCIADLINNLDQNSPSFFYNFGSLKGQDKPFSFYRNLIHEASLLYDSRFENSPTVLSKAEGVNLNLESIESVQTYTHLLRIVLIEVARVKDLYSTTLEKVAQNARNEYSDKYFSLKEDLKTFQEEFLSYTSTFGTSQPEKPKLLAIISKTKEHYKAFEVLAEKCHVLVQQFKRFDENLDFPQYNDVRGIDLTMQFCKSLLRGWQTYESKHVSMSIKRVNALNAQEPMVEECHKSLYSILQLINSHSLFVVPLECNAKSTTKEFEYLVALSNQLSSILADLESVPHYFRWHQLMQGMPSESVKILDILKSHSTEKWVQLFEEGYVKSYIQSRLLPDMLSNADLYDKALDLYSAAMLSKSNSYTSISELEIQAYLTQLKKTDPVSLEFINSTGQIEPFSTFTGISLLNLDELSDFDPSFTNIVWSENPDFQNKGVMTVAEDSNSGQGFYHNLPIKPISKIPVTERNHAAKILANALLSCHLMPRILHHKNANIISFGSTWFHERIEHEISKLKEFNLSDKPLDLLIESILETSRTQYLIVRDGLLNPKQTESILWQRYIIDHMKTAGFQIIEEWTMARWQGKSNIGPLEALHSIHPTQHDVM